MRPLLSAAAVSLALTGAPAFADPDASCEEVVATTSAGQGAPAPIATELANAEATTPDPEQAMAASKCVPLVGDTVVTATTTFQAPVNTAMPAAAATSTAAVPVDATVGAGAAAATAATASTIVPAAPGTLPTTTTTTTTTTPGQAVVDPASYQPKTEFDNTPWRFNMEQDGKRMTADEFTAWMEARGVRVARGAARPVSAQNPAGDGRPPNWSSATAGQVGEAVTTTVTTTPTSVAPAQTAPAAATAAATESVVVPVTPVPTSVAPAQTVPAAATAAATESVVVPVTPVPADAAPVPSTDVVPATDEGADAQDVPEDGAEAPPTPR